MPSAAATSSAAPLSRAEIRRIIFGLMMAMLLAALDQTIVATALPTIGREPIAIADCDCGWPIADCLLKIAI